MTDPLASPLAFRPAYQVLVWGGRRLARWRSDLPEGPVGESWDLADHPRGPSVVADGPLAGTTLGELTRSRGRDLVGAAWDGGEFPLMVKFIDASERLSVQVHPDDAQARALGVGRRGKTECWLVLEDGGELYAGLRPGVTREGFAAALAAGRVADCLRLFPADDGTAVFLPARTVHALGAGCLVCEVQQTCDATFRVDDWGRLGLDGRPRQLHVEQALATIDFSGSGGGGLVEAAWTPHPAGGRRRSIASAGCFAAEERRAERTAGGGGGGFTIAVCLAGTGSIATAAGSLPLAPLRTILVPACAGPWQAQADAGELRLLVAAA